MKKLVRFWFNIHRHGFYTAEEFINLYSEHYSKDAEYHVEFNSPDALMIWKRDHLESLLIKDGDKYIPLTLSTLHCSVYKFCTDVEIAEIIMAI